MEGEGDEIKSEQASKRDRTLHPTPWTVESVARLLLSWCTGVQQALKSYY